MNIWLVPSALLSVPRGIAPENSWPLPFAELPRAFRHGNHSAAALVAACAYVEKPEALTTNDLIAYLELNADLVGEWIQYSHDKRTTSAWFISKASGVRLLAFFPDGARHTFSNEPEACAAFIELEVADIAKAAG